MGADGVPQSSEIDPGPGFRVRREIERPAADEIQRLAELDIALVADMMNRLYVMRPGLLPISPNPAVDLTGPVCTVKVFPGDNLMIHASLDIARPGDVVVVDTAGASHNAVFGDMVANKAVARGIAGFVIDGLVRDVEGIIETGLPVYARGTTPRGPLHRGPGEVNYPISCGGLSVAPGDIVKASPDGVILVPREAVRTVLARAETKATKEADYVAAVRRGEFSNQWVTDMLEANGCDGF